MTDLKTVSLFAGIGGIDRGLELAGAKTALMCELDPHARKILARHYPHAAIHNDVTELTADDCRNAGAVPERTILTAGFPCQDLSVAGRRRGMGQGTRSGLYWHVDRLLAEFRPAWVILENVPGLLSAACPCPGDGTCSDTCPGELHAVPGGVCEGGCVNVHGGTMGAVLGSLAERGYGFSYRVLDARHFGVPQRRRRVVIVGRLGDTGTAPAQVLLEPEGLPGDPAQGITPRPHTASHAGEGVAGGRVVSILGDHAHSLTAEGHDASEDGTGRGTPIIAFSHTAGIDIQHSTAVTPTIKAGHDATPSIVYAADYANALDTAQGGPDDNTAQGGHLVAFALRGREEGALPEIHGDGQTIGSLRAAGGGSSRDYIAYAPEFIPALTTRAGNTQDDQQTGQLVAFAENQRGELTTSDTLPSLKVGGGKPGQGYPAVTDGVIVRRLTPLECERLQGFPDNWTEGQADSHRSKQLGNSVAVPVFEWVGRRLVAVDSALEAS